MKKLFIAILTLTLFLATLTPVNAAFDRTYTAPKGTPTVDAVVDDVWANAEWTNVDKPHDEADDSDSKIRVKLLWDDEHLYFLAEIIDNAYHNDDMFEVYIDQKNDKTNNYHMDDSQTRFRLSGSVNPDSGTNRKTDSLVAANKINENTYIMEGAIKWTLNMPVSAGQPIGLEFMYSDGAGDNGFVEAYRWNVDTAGGDTPPFKSTKDFGTLYLAEADGTVPEYTTTERPPRDTGDDTTKAPDADPDEKGEEEPSEFPIGIVIGIAAAVVVIVAVVIVVVAASKKKKQ